MAKIFHVYESKYDGFITVIWQRSVKQYEGIGLCPNVVKAYIKRNGIKELNCFKDEVPFYH